MKFQRVLQACRRKARAALDALALRLLLWIEKEPNDDRIGSEPGAPHDPIVRG